jgi:hypothetical protein
MKRVLLILLLLSLPAICLAQEKVYHNNDLKKGITPPPVVSQPGTVVITPPPPAAPANRSPASLTPPVQSDLFPIQNPNLVIHNSTPAAPAVKIRPVTPPKPYNPFAGLTLLFFMIAAIPFLVWIIAMADILRNESPGSNKMIWFLAATFLPLVGPILYFFIGTAQKIRPEDEEEPVV